MGGVKSEPKPEDIGDKSSDFKSDKPSVDCSLTVDDANEDPQG